MHIQMRKLLHEKSEFLIWNRAKVIHQAIMIDGDPLIQNEIK